MHSPTAWVYRFSAGNGLYLLAGFDSEVVQQRVETLLHSLSYSGIGGKRSAGLGRFTLSVEAVPQGLAHRLMDNGAPAMTLSVAMAPARSNWNRCWRVLNICCKSALASWHRQGMHRNRGESGTFTPSALKLLLPKTVRRWCV